MGYIDPDRGYKGISYGVGAMSLLLLWFGVKMLAAFGGAMSVETPATAETKLLADPDGAKLFATIKRTYPDEFEGLKRTIVERSRASANDAQMQRAVLDYLIAAGRRHRADMVQAPHEALANYRHSEIALVESLQRASPDLCAEFVTKGSFYAPAGNAQLSAAQLIDFRRVAWEGYAAGRDYPAHRKIGRPSAQTWRAIQGYMAEDGLTPTQIALYFDNAAIARAAPVEQCRVGLGFLRAIDRMPDDDGDAFYAALAAGGT